MLKKVPHVFGLRKSGRGTCSYYGDRTVSGAYCPLVVACWCERNINMINGRFLRIELSLAWFLQHSVEGSLSGLLWLGWNSGRLLMSIANWDTNQGQNMLICFSFCCTLLLWYHARNLSWPLTLAYSELKRVYVSCLKPQLWCQTYILSCGKFVNDAKAEQPSSC